MSDFDWDNGAALMVLIDHLADGQWRDASKLFDKRTPDAATLARRIVELQEWSITVESDGNGRFRLSAPVERLHARHIVPALSPAAGKALNSIAVVTHTDSTNQRLIEAPADTEPEALFAELQSAGRGRLGRAWKSPFGANLYLSISWVFASTPKVGALPIAVGVRCAEALRAIGLATVGVKWPNDLCAGNHKLGGILCESRSLADGRLRVVTGIGLNVAMSDRQGIGIDQPWTSVDRELAAAGIEPVGRNRIAGIILSALVEAMLEFERHGFAPFASRWPAFDLADGRSLHTLSGDVARAGIGCGIEADGGLLVDFGQGPESIIAGEISLRFDTPANDGVPTPGAGPRPQ